LLPSLAVSEVKMSFGFGVSDFVLLLQFASSTVEGARRACGEHNEITRELSTLYTVLDHLESEISNPTSVLGSAEQTRRTELKAMSEAVSVTFDA